MDRRFQATSQCTPGVNRSGRGGQPAISVRPACQATCRQRTTSACDDESASVLPGWLRRACRSRRASARPCPCGEPLRTPPSLCVYAVAAPEPRPSRSRFGTVTDSSVAFFSFFSCGVSSFSAPCDVRVCNTDSNYGVAFTWPSPSLARRLPIGGAILRLHAGVLLAALFAQTSFQWRSFRSARRSQIHPP